MPSTYWTDGEDIGLLALCAARFHLREVADALGRSEAAISLRSAMLVNRLFSAPDDEEGLGDLGGPECRGLLPAAGGRAPRGPTASRQSSEGSESPA